MLKVTIDGEEYEYNQTKLMASEASMIQRYAGRTVKEWGAGIEAGDIDCIIPLVWLIKKRQGHTASFESFGLEEGGWDFDLGGFKIEDPEQEAKAKEAAEDEASPDPTSPESDEVQSAP
jgi:hypothetical protein